MNHSLGYVLLVLAIYMLVVARLTRLINVDRIAAPIRLWPANRAALADLAAHELEQAGKDITAEQFRRRAQRWDLVAYLLKCPWCVGLWFALATAIAPVLVIGWAWWVLFPVGLACSYVVGVLESLLTDEEVDTVPVDDGTG